MIRELLRAIWQKLGDGAMDQQPWRGQSSELFSGNRENPWMNATGKLGAQGRSNWW